MGSKVMKVLARIAFFCWSGSLFSKPLLEMNHKPWIKLWNHISTDTRILEILTRHAYRPHPHLLDWKANPYDPQAWQLLSPFNPFVLSLTSTQTNTLAKILSPYRHSEVELLNVAILNRGGFVLGSLIKMTRLHYGGEKPFLSVMSLESSEKKVETGYSALYNRKILDVIQPIEKDYQVIGALWSVWDAEALKKRKPTYPTETKGQRKRLENVRVPRIRPKRPVKDLDPFPQSEEEVQEQQEKVESGQVE